MALIPRNKYKSTQVNKEIEILFRDLNQTVNAICHIHSFGSQENGALRRVFTLLNKMNSFQCEKAGLNELKMFHTFLMVAPADCETFISQRFSKFSYVRTFFYSDMVPYRIILDSMERTSESLLLKVQLNKSKKKETLSNGKKITLKNNSQDDDASLEN